MKFIFLFITALVLYGCKENFSPNGPYEDRMVIYAVFDADSAVQIVRIYSTTNPAVYDPFAQLPSNEIVGASVVVKSDTLVYSFHDTVITRQTEHGVQVIHAYVHNTFKILSDRKYVLSVNALGFPQAQSTFSGLGEGYLLQVNTNVFFNPAVEENISFDLYPGKNVTSYLLTLHLDYEVKRNGVWVRKIFEVPTAYTEQAKYYPQITAADGSSVIRGTFSVQSYKKAIDEIRSNPQDTIHFSQAVITLHQFDNALYTYYSVANNFPGGTTLRLDEPDYSNVIGGYGVVGVTNTFIRRYPLQQNP